MQTIPAQDYKIPMSHIPLINLKCQPVVEANDIMFI